MDKNIVKVLASLALAFGDKNLKTAVYFLDKKLRVKMTKTWKAEKSFTLTIGRPNYAEKVYLNKFIKVNPNKSVQKLAILKYFKKK